MKKLINWSKLDRSEKRILFSLLLSFIIFIGATTYIVVNENKNEKIEEGGIIKETPIKVYNTKELVLAPVEKDFVSVPRETVIAVLEETTTEPVTEETTTEQITEEVTTVEETTTEEVTTEEIVTEPVINRDTELDNYIYSLIETYSGNETRMDLNYDNIYLLAQLSESEAGEEPFEGKIAVCEVVLNRYYKQQASSIRDIIFARNQFSVVNNGTIYNVPSHDSVLAAVQASLGESPTNGSLYFQDVRYVSNTWASKNREESVLIGNHQFFY